MIETQPKNHRSVLPKFNEFSQLLHEKIISKLFNINLKALNVTLNY